MDIISQVLRALHFDANIYLHSEFCSPWQVPSDNQGLSSFHVIAFGHCTIRVKGREPIYLGAGDLIFFPVDIEHTIEHLGMQDNVVSTSLICGHFNFGDSANPLLASLPQVIHIRAQEIAKLNWFESLIRQIVNEAESGTEGRSLILDKLSEILFIYILRYYVLTSADNQGLLAGLTHSQISQALLAFHQDMSKVWSVELLAEQAAMSRSAFSDKFTSLVELTPMQYVTFWRMQSAMHKLTHSQEGILSIALEHGYQSEASFSKVFKKQFDMPPGKVRKQLK